MLKLKLNTYHEICGTNVDVARTMWYERMSVAFDFGVTSVIAQHTPPLPCACGESSKSLAAIIINIYDATCQKIYLQQQQTTTKTCTIIKQYANEWNEICAAMSTNEKNEQKASVGASRGLRGGFEVDLRSKTQKTICWTSTCYWGK